MHRCFFCFLFCFFFFKQKTAYEMRISDWSSDVCSSDLDVAAHEADLAVRLLGKRPTARLVDVGGEDMRALARQFQHRCLADTRRRAGDDGDLEIGRASCRERVCQYV